MNLSVGVSRGQRIVAGILVLLAIGAFWTQSFPSSGFTCCGFLLYAWSLTYYPAPGFRATVGEVYQSARQGRWITPKYVRLVMFLAVILMSIGFWFPFKH